MPEPRLGDTDAERAVLADAWTEAGDIRGELTTLDLQIAARPADRVQPLIDRARALRDANLPALLGPLHPLVTACTWDRGALDTVELDLSDGLPDEVAEDPRWQTVTAVGIRAGDADAIATVVRGVPHLRTLRGRVTVDALAPLAMGPPLPIERLELARRAFVLDPAGDVEDLLRAPGFAGLRALTLRDPVPAGFDPAPWFYTPIGQRLTVVEVPAPFVDLPLWFHATAGHPTLARLRIDEMLGNTSWTITRTDAGRVLTADVRLAILTIWRRSVKSDVAVAEVLDLLPPRSVSDVHVTIGSSYRGTPGTRRRLEESVDRVCT
jgi:hypothetical protein